MFDFKKKKDVEMKMSPMEQDAKMSVLGGMKSGAEQDMLEKLKGLKQVSVASSEPAGLVEGLEKAKEMIAGKSEDPAHEHMEAMTEGMSAEELQALIDKLLEKKGLLEGSELVRPSIAH